MRTLSTVLIKSGSFTGSFSGSSVNVTTISSSYGYFGLNAVVNGILRVFDVVYAYAGVVGSVTGSLSGSKIIVNELTASNLYAEKITLNQITASSISSSYIITSQLTASNGSFTDLSTSVLTSQTASFNYLSINNTGSAPTNITSPGLPGEIRFDNNFIYIYTSENWLRVPIAKWS